MMDHLRTTPSALSTGQAARFCLVTADTIVNWIKRSKLPARRTVGGQYRILVRDLRNYMIEHGMSIDLLDGAFETRRYCWEHEGCGGAGPILGVDCEDCLVFRSRTLNCFELRAALTPVAEHLGVCARCEYLDDWRIDPASTPVRCSSVQRRWHGAERRRRDDHVE